VLSPSHYGDDFECVRPMFFKVGMIKSHLFYDGRTKNISALLNTKTLKTGQTGLRT